jgi:hypothetical protein
MQLNHTTDAISPQNMGQWRFAGILSFGKVTVRGIQRGVTQLQNRLTRLEHRFGSLSHPQMIDPIEFIQKPRSHGTKLAAGLTDGNDDRGRARSPPHRPDYRVLDSQLFSLVLDLGFKARMSGNSVPRVNSEISLAPLSVCVDPGFVLLGFTIE